MDNLEVVEVGHGRRDLGELNGLGEQLGEKE